VELRERKPLKAPEGEKVSLNMGQDERKAAELGHTCLTYLLTYTSSCQDVK